MNIRLIQQFIICFAMFFLSLVLTGCESAKTTSQPTLQATAALAPPLTPNIEPPPTATDEASATPRASITPQPSETLSLTERAYGKYWDSVEETETASAPLTEEAQSTLNAAFPESCGSKYSYASPDGNWMADDCGEFLVVSRDGQKKIAIKHSQFNTPTITVSNVVPHYWSKDSQYLYFSPHFCCANTNPYHWEGPLYRLDIQSSTWIKIIDSGAFNLYSFSPTGRRLLHIPNVDGSTPPLKLHIIDLKSGTEQWLTLDGFEKAGDILWSPDGTRFVISGQNGEPFQGEDIDPIEIALFLVSLDDFSITNLIPVLSPSGTREILSVVDWSIDDVLTIDDCYFYQFQEAKCNLVMYDLKAPRIISATATP